MRVAERTLEAVLEVPQRGILKKYKAALQSARSTPRSRRLRRRRHPHPSAKQEVAASPSSSAPAEQSEPLDPFGELIPYADPNWYQSVSFCHLERERKVLLEGVNSDGENSTTRPTQ